MRQVLLVAPILIPLVAGAFGRNPVPRTVTVVGLVGSRLVTDSSTVTAGTTTSGFTQSVLSSSRATSAWMSGSSREIFSP